MMLDVSPNVAWTEMAGFPCAGAWTDIEQVVDLAFKVLGSEWETHTLSLNP
ncbi:hypothetical protein LNV23_08045 [Paucibacter sp. DJ1R-11]|nr:hypothetical protein [Paucibacter sp. DJ1R-11]